ncbi:patatin-like phospholipase family protein [Cohnella terricola]|uniref:Patatin family protein n=1 Tax=Cohnella terricola TaxID=1289167 RepID=A0A559JGY4_9BACL|nr:patatin family protein [Cohnella terricola]TVX99132.1 patatin family protein [Cohnella terricola]
MESVGLVLEGGGMRSVYTAGVLEYFAEQNVYFPYIVGVSAGACVASSYLSRQKGRNKKVNVDWVSDPRYLSWRNWFKNRQLFGMDFIFDEIPNSLAPFDNEAFAASSEELAIGTTDCETGKAVYHYKSDPDFDLLSALRASSSLPFIAPIVEYKGKPYLDGGISDPIPLRQAERDGYSRNILILTRNSDYLKSPNRMAWLVRRAYGKYPKFVDTMLTRHKVYNDTVTYIEQQERAGAAFVIRPEQTLKVGRMERDPVKLQALYEQGYEDAKRLLPTLQAWASR